MNGYLLVRSGGAMFGLPVESVIEVVDDMEARPVPGVGRAVRGVAKLRDRLVPVLHLGALLTNTEPPSVPSHTVVLTTCGGRHLALEVDDAEEVVRDTPLPAPPGGKFPWATGVAVVQNRMVPVVDFAALAERLAGIDDRDNHER